MNREAKSFHPVYNNMEFPDSLNEPSRTVTATCTRVSRESIVVADKRNNGYRRLSIRERASLQSFPVTYQFYGRSHSQKVKMIGNAVPPLFSWFVGLAAKGLAPDIANKRPNVLDFMAFPKVPATITLPHGIGKTYPAQRRFRSAINGLRFKSGMRFELANQIANQSLTWGVNFFYGPSKDIKTVPLDKNLLKIMKRNKVISEVLEKHVKSLNVLSSFISETPKDKLQLVWTNRLEGLGPYDLVDRISA